MEKQNRQTCQRESRILEIVQQPLSYPKHKDYDKIRVTSIAKYKYRIFYKVLSKIHVKIILVQHTSQSFPTDEEFRKAARS
jgi:hypothetical protein